MAEIGIGAWLGYAMTAASVAGAGISYYGQKEAAKTNDALTDFNARAARQNAELEQRYREIEAGINQAQLDAQASQMQANARLLEQAAANNEATTRENIRRKRQDFMRLRARQRAKIAGSGVIETGSPIEVLASQAGEMELAIQDMMVEGENRTRDMLNQAKNERFGASQTIFSKQTVSARRLAAGLAGSNARSSAEIGRLTGQAQSSQIRSNALGTLFSGATETAGGIYKDYRQGAYTSG